MVAHVSCGDDTSPRSCVGCGAEIRDSGKGRPRRWCTDACRQTARRAASPTSQAAAPAAAPISPGPEVEGEIAARQGCTEAPENPPADAAGTFRSWYYANFASPAGQDLISTRRKLRYRLRGLLREVTTIDRCKLCGWEPLGGGIVVKVGHKNGRNSAGFGGLETCGRVWLCPVCAAKVRVRRGDQIAEGVMRHLEAGYWAWFLTVTLPHEKGDALKASFDALTKALQYVKSGKRYQEDKERFGILGDIKAVEVTHGANGWHPHAHVLILTTKEISFDEICAWYARLDARWAAGLRKVGWPEGKPGVRLTLKPVEKGEGLAAYLTKVQEKGVGNELARADMKDAREGNRTPFGILADFGNYALADDLELWWEYEQTTIGRSAIRWSRGLWAKLMPDEDQATDEEIAAEEHEGESIAVLARYTWYRIRAIPGAEVAVLEAVERDGWSGLIETLLRLRIGTKGVYTPDEWATPNEVDIVA